MSEFEINSYNNKVLQNFYKFYNTSNLDYVIKNQEEIDEQNFNINACFSMFVSFFIFIPYIWNINGGVSAKIVLSFLTLLTSWIPLFLINKLFKNKLFCLFPRFSKEINKYKINFCAIQNQLEIESNQFVLIHFLDYFISNYSNNCCETKSEDIDRKIKNFDNLKNSIVSGFENKDFKSATTNFFKFLPDLKLFFSQDVWAIANNIKHKKQSFKQNFLSYLNDFEKSLSQDSNNETNSSVINKNEEKYKEIL
jgi:hypothetical protein